MGKKFPADYSKIELASLVLYHQNTHIEIGTKLTETREKLIQVSKELSTCKKQTPRV